MRNISQFLSSELVKINLQSKDKKSAIKELSGLFETKQIIKDKNQYIADVLKREEEVSTELDNGVAIPHAKSAAVIKPAVAIGISRNGIDFSGEGRLSYVIFLIAIPQNANDTHISILSNLTSHLLETDCIQKIKGAKTEQEVVDIFSKEIEEEHQTRKGGRFLIGVTGCTVGVAHTYLAQKALEKAANEIGVTIKVETNGSIGIENSPTKEEIEHAEGIIIASDRETDMERFAGKRVINTSAKKGIDEPKELIMQILDKKAPIYKHNQKKTVTHFEESDTESQHKSLYKVLMSGVSYMIPFVVIGGLLIAISLAIGGEPTPNGLVIPEGSFWNKISAVGSTGFTLMIPILAGYIASAIGDRAALAPGMIGGWIANNGSFYNSTAGTGFIGAIIAGLLVGYFVKWLKHFKYPEAIQPLVPIMLIPITASLFIAFIFIFIIGMPISSLMTALNAMLQRLSTGSLIILGIVVGLMQGFDMGGPFGKVAFMFSVGLIAEGQPQFMGAQACAIPVAPLGMALATFLDRKHRLFQSEETANGKAALAMGLVGISEGAIPFAASDPFTVIPANMIGSAVSCTMGFLFGITDTVAHGGPIVLLLGAVNKPLIGLLCMMAGASVTALICLTLKKYKYSKVEKSYN
ncbi:PTS fructose transporter subunit IIC [Acidilutibacter cellobiosedens]|jgi:PTS system fructose-specific IIC component|uniref:PTS fructose transporter subunit IIC n=1 Tax=Acidilutibacter cellobiosedens TaxID=2507161 RepID=A0A410QFP3_9FIRM|nr:fructose-specific PTS transporter subunit EIIC [Acidilutibacter cellobiosedens]QAT62830.1 PTS fructose transporter subunit IIC [Acidilutibacter cellobiosedens]